MMKNLVRNEEGRVIQWDSDSDNCTTKIDDKGVYHHFCIKCGTNTEDMRFIRETGYYEREVTHKCKCGLIVIYGG